MNNYTLKLTMAALLGASFVAVLAYYAHWTQLLEFAKAVECIREYKSRHRYHHRKRRGHHRSGSRRKANGYHGRDKLNGTPDLVQEAMPACRAPYQKGIKSGN